MELYKCPIVTDAVVAKCMEDGSAWRPHPELPGLEEAKQFRVTVSDGQVHLLEHIISRGVSFQGKADMPGALGIAQKLRAAPDLYFLLNSRWYLRCLRL